MGLLRRRSDEPVGERFLMREKLLAIGDDFWIENDRGEWAYKVNGKALRVRQTGRRPADSQGRRSRQRIGGPYLRVPGSKPPGSASSKPQDSARP